MSGSIRCSDKPKALMAGLLLLSFCLCPLLAGTGDSYPLNAEATLCGKVVIKTYWGPPGYGQHPESDTKKDVHVLILDRRIKISGNGPANGKDEAKKEASAKEIQLGWDYESNKNLAGRTVCVRGKINESAAASDYLPFVFDVQEILFVSPEK